MKELFKSIRAVVTLIVVFTFCTLAFMGKVEAKDFVPVVSLIVSFYFVLKQRPDEQKPQNGSGNGDKGA